MAKGVILVTPRSLSKHPPAALERLKASGFEIRTPWPGKQPAEDELKEHLPGCIGYLAGVEKIPASVLKQADSLCVISRNGVGMDNIDLDAAEQLGIKVLGTPGANAQGVAELTIALVFNAARSVSWSSSKLKQGAWERQKGWELTGKTLGVIGCGQIGKRVSRMAAALGMNVLGYDMYHDSGMEGISGFAYAELHELLERSDVLTLHCPPGDTPMIREDTLPLLKKGAALINTARADLVDEQVLMQAIEKGVISHYAVDVFDREPPALNDLILHERVTVTPHIGGFTEESVQRATERAVENLLNVLSEGE